MHGAIPSLPKYAFMAWFSVKRILPDVVRVIKSR
jgi:hypothetical protein